MPGLSRKRTEFANFFPGPFAAYVAGGPPRKPLTQENSTPEMERTCVYMSAWHSLKWGLRLRTPEPRINALLTLKFRDQVPQCQLILLRRLGGAIYLLEGGDAFQYLSHPIGVQRSHPLFNRCFPDFLS